MRFNYKIIVALFSLFLANHAQSQVYGEGLVINEFMAVNDSTSNIEDQDGEHEDWIEIYNNSNQNFDLSGFYLSDKLDNPTKWTFPAGASIAAGGFVVVWADEDGEQAGLHANFKLSRDGEDIILSNPFEEELDAFTFGYQEANIPMARAPNGTGNFVMQAPTIGYSNDDATSTSNLSDRFVVNIYPNPVKDYLHLSVKPRADDAGTPVYSATILSTTGQVIRKYPQDQTPVTVYDVSNLAPGAYWLRMEVEGGKQSFLFVKQEE
jgi:hypothetical protein